ncbi:MAG: CDP-alcohol phosphatidyltransferase family protein [archaeon]
MVDKNAIPFFNMANSTSIIRILLLPLYTTLIIYGDTTQKKAAIILCIVIFLMDYLDGWIAKKMDIKTKIGSHLDVIADRITELFLWLTFLSFGLVPLWAPLILLSRSMITDLIRSQAITKQIGTYDMIKSDTGRFIVNSRTMRGLYGGLKMLLFTLLTASFTTHTQDILAITPALIAIVVLIGIIRGLPVIHEGIKYLK